MAREIGDPAAAARFLRQLAVLPGAAEAAERMLSVDARTTRVLGSGWRRLEGVLVLGEHARAGGERPALVAAAHERALRDLLLALPRGEQLRLHLGADWHAETVADVLAGHLVPDRADCFVGVKRGAAAVEGGAGG